MDARDFPELKRLAIFAAVVDQGGFAHAAEFLGISPSRVSEQLALLEQSMGMRLMQRTTRKFTLTQEGEALLIKARQIVQTFDSERDYTKGSAVRQSQNHRGL